MEPWRIAVIRALHNWKKALWELRQGNVSGHVLTRTVENVEVVSVDADLDDDDPLSKVTWIESGGGRSDVAAGTSIRCIEDDDELHHDYADDDALPEREARNDNGLAP
ncbi:MAG: hypothetical protein Q9218_003302 [Villophora microphyllina]